MLYPGDIESKIGFDRIREILRTYCLGPLGIQRLDRLELGVERPIIKQSLDQTEEFHQLLIQQLDYPKSGYLDCTESLAKIPIEGISLSQEEFHDVRAAVGAMLGWSDFLVKHKEEIPNLSPLAKALTVDKKLYDGIDQVIDERGEIRSGASAELKRIRQDIHSKKKRARRAVELFLKRSIQSNYSPADSSVSIRNGRLVIPVIAQFKRNVQGFIHDESSSGQTSYIEPAEVLELNNEITDLEYQERREIIRILTRLTSFTRQFLPDLDSGFNFLGEIDFIQAKARLAQSLAGIKPRIVADIDFDWKKAHHPLLLIAYRRQKKVVVPLDLDMSGQQRILIISGPNAGGKSVCLKTVALLQYMVQCGLLVPMEEGSSVAIFKDIFIDIGDQQSLENDLSTYSSHIKNMNFLLKKCSSESLFLIDEFGTGTDPQFGGSIAQAVLEELNNKGAFGIVTTHYSNLKKMASEFPGIVNGAMRFDRNKLEPLYQLEIGTPGSSFSLEIARKMGLPVETLNRAKQMIGIDQVKLDQMLSDIEQEKSELNRQRDLLARNNKEVRESISELKAKSQFLEKEKKRILDEAKQQAKEILDQSNRRIESIIREIRESAANKEITKRLRKDLDQFKGSILPVQKPPPKKAARKLEVGDKVQIEGQEAIGEVVRVSKKDAEILIGQLKSTVRINRLKRVQKGSTEKRKFSSAKKYGLDITEKAKAFQSDLDLRGKRAEEALKEVDRCLDDALLLGAGKIRIIHGKGYGILREVIRKHLEGSDFVEEIKDEDISQGGAGVSAVFLK